MSRRHAAVAVVLLAVGGLLPLAPARAGGFCSGAVGTDTEFADRRGDTVTMVANCFTPTVLRVARGTTVTFVNEDPDVHSVGGAAGTFGDLHREIPGGEAVRYAFEADGVFPYACVFHPGMTGAIVVGDGEGSATRAGIVSGDGDRSSSKPAGEAGVSTLALPLGIALVLLVAAVVALGARRKDAAAAP